MYIINKLLFLEFQYIQKKNGNAYRTMYQDLWSCKINEFEEEMGSKVNTKRVTINKLCFCVFYFVSLVVLRSKRIKKLEEN